jgi:hypothetical protein
MAKKAKGNNYVSKGERSSVAKSLLKACRREFRSADSMATLMNKQAAWRAGRPVTLTVPNPDKKNTKERFIKVSANEYWGYPRQMQLKMRSA